MEFLFKSNPDKELLLQAIDYFNRNLLAHNFQYLVRNEKILVEDCDSWLLRQKRKLDFRVVILDASENVVGLGYVSKGGGRQKSTAKIGFTVEPSHHGKGIGKALCLKLIRGAEGIGIKRLETDPFVNNDRAIALLQACGFHREGLLRNRVQNELGEFIDTMQMSLLLPIDLIKESDAILCPFCSPQIDHRQVFQGEFNSVIIPKKVISLPQCLVVPQAHYRSLTDLPKFCAEEMFLIAYELAKIIKENFAADGINVFMQSGVAAGQSLEHVHLHVLPRFFGDIDNPDRWLDEKFENMHYVPNDDQIEIVAVHLRNKLREALSK